MANIMKLGCGGTIGCLAIPFFILLGVMIGTNSNQERNAGPPSKPVSRSDQIAAGSLSNFRIDEENRQYVFDLSVSNKTNQAQTVYAVVYGKNDNISPPRRDAWPFAGLLFSWGKTRRGALSSSSLSANWNERPRQAKGMQIQLGPNATQALEGALNLNPRSGIAAFDGQSIKPLTYEKLWLWLYSENGSLIQEQEYNVKVSSFLYLPQL